MTEDQTKNEYSMTPEQTTQVVMLRSQLLLAKAVLCDAHESAEKASQEHALAVARLVTALDSYAKAAGLQGDVRLSDDGTKIVKV